VTVTVAVTVAGWLVAFRGSCAVAAGLVSRNRLRGPGFRRVYRDTYVRSGDELTLTLRSLAAYRYAAGCGVLSGHSAAELLRVLWSGGRAGRDHDPRRWPAGAARAAGSP